MPLRPLRHRHNTPQLMLNRRRFTLSRTPLTLRLPPSIRFPIRLQPTLTTTAGLHIATGGIHTTAPRSGSVSDMATADMATAGIEAAGIAVVGIAVVAFVVGGMAGTANYWLICR